MSEDITKKRSSLVEFSKAIGAVLGAPIILFTIINNIFREPIVSLVIAIITGIGLSIWLAYSRKMNFAYLAIAWLGLFVIILLGFVIWPNTMTLEGFVTDTNGKPIANETVRFFDYRGQIYETKTDQDGFYQFVDVPTGKYKIRVYATEIRGESKGLLVRVVSQSISVSSGVVDTPTLTPTNTTSSQKVTDSPMPTNTATLTQTPRPTSTATLTPTSTDTATLTQTPRPTNTATLTPTSTDTATPTQTPRPTNTARPTSTPTAAPASWVETEISKNNTVILKEPNLFSSAFPVRLRQGDKVWLVGTNETRDWIKVKVFFNNMNGWVLTDSLEPNFSVEELRVIE